jgi:hypothetical protein
MTPEEIAHVCHEANRAYCQILLDVSHHEWGMISSELRDSVISGVKALLADPTITAEQIHQNWLDYKRAEGWVPGPIKNEKTKEHPNMLPFHELPSGEQVKDRLFVAIVRALS